MQPRPTRVIRHVWVPLPDGTRLAARVWLPEDAEERPVPAILEYIPYRKNDATAARDETIHPEFARAGYAALRVDLRGSGDSDGIMVDEYAPSELQDGLDVIQWIADQPWCDGGVGIIGKSWGGFNGLQLAALRPPALRAIITVCSTDDRYADDVHYNGGVILGSEMLPWASTMLAYNARPPDPAVIGEAWREQWLERMEKSPIYSEIWLSHQRRDAYWKHGSVCEDYASINVPVLTVGGLYDEYRTTLFRLLENVDAPVHALLGPWAHNYPHQGAPGPAIDFIAESVRWWDRWLKGTANGVDEQPRLRAYMPSSSHPDTGQLERAGRWVAEQSWPSGVRRTMRFADADLAGPRGLSSTADIGADAGDWLQFGEVAGQQINQSADDAASFTATWPPSTEPVELLGVPEVTLTVRSDQPFGAVALRLCDVALDGSSRLLTAGLRNLTHEQDHEEPVPLAPGVARTVRVPLLATAHRLEPGHRFRVSVSASYWPWMWPSPDATTIDITLDPQDALELPVRGRTDDVYRDECLDRTPSPAPVSIEVGDEPLQRTVSSERPEGERSITVRARAIRRDPHDGLRYEGVDRNQFTRGTEAGSARAECWRVEHLGRDATDNRLADWDARVETYSRMTEDSTHFHLYNEVCGFEHGEKVFSRSWSTRVSRDYN